MHKLRKLECMRGFAAFYVLLDHIAPRDNQVVTFILHFGQEAVMLFFLLSGFVIYYSYYNSADKSFHRYFQHRFQRIYPIFLLALALAAAVAPHKASLASLLGNLLMLQDIGRSKPGVLVNPFAGNEPLWSLSYEWWFYILFFIFIRRTRQQYRDALVFVGSAIGAVTYMLVPNQISLIVAYFVIWWAGAALARAFIERRPIPWAPAVFLSLQAAIWAGPVLAALHHGIPLKLSAYPMLPLRNTGFAIVALCVAGVWQRAGWRGFEAIFGWFGVLAPISYGLYALHFPVTAALVDDASWRTLPIVIAGCLAAATFAELVYQKAAVQVIRLAVARLGRVQTAEATLAAAPVLAVNAAAEDRPAPTAPAP